MINITPTIYTSSDNVWKTEESLCPLIDSDELKHRISTVCPGGLETVELWAKIALEKYMFEHFRARSKKHHK